MSDVLVRCWKWSSPAVLAERDIILGSDQAAFDGYVATWRAKAVTLFQEAWSQVQKAETAAFGPKSYFSGCGDISEDDDDPNPELEKIIKHKSVWLDAIVDDVGSKKRKRAQDESEPELSSSDESEEE